MPAVVKPASKKSVSSKTTKKAVAAKPAKAKKSAVKKYDTTMVGDHIRSHRDKNGKIQKTLVKAHPRKYETAKPKPATMKTALKKP